MVWEWRIRRLWHNHFKMVLCNFDDPVDGGTEVIFWKCIASNHVPIKPLGLANKVCAQLILLRKFKITFVKNHRWRHFLKFRLKHVNSERIAIYFQEKTSSTTGMPDALFSNQISKFGKFLEGLEMEDVGIFCGHLVHFTVFCYILWTSGIVRGNLVHFPPFWYFVPRKIWQPCSTMRHLFKRCMYLYSIFSHIHYILISCIMSAPEMLRVPAFTWRVSNLRLLFLCIPSRGCKTTVDDNFKIVRLPKSGLTWKVKYDIV
jgi:hypothetical protein